MITKDWISILKDKQYISVNDRFNNDNRYSNLNLYQPYKCSVLIPIQSYFKSDSIKYSPVSDNYEEEKKSYSWNKSSKIPFFTSVSENFDESKKRWTKRGSSDIKNSTLSLHISAYENSVKADASESFKGLEKDKSGTMDKWGSSKQIFASLLSQVKNPFEFPRQQSEEVTEPEVSQYTASQQLLSFNEVSSCKNIMDVPYQKLFERCGTKLCEEKLNQILERCKEKPWKIIGGTPKVGAVVDGYKILGYLGSGSWGTACLALKNDFYFVLKFMRVNYSQRGATKEFKILHAQLKFENYEHCLTALEWHEWTEWKNFDFGDLKQELEDRNEKLRYMVIKLAGPSFDAIRIQYSGVFPINQGIRLMKKSLLALQSLHEKNLIHRDLKLDNMAVHVENEEHVVILDYGMVCKVPRYENKYNSTDNFREDYKAWLKSFFTFEYALAARQCSVSNSLDEPTFWSTRNSHAEQILKHINRLKFCEKMNFYFIQECLQNMYDEANGIRVIPYVYKKVTDRSKIIVHGNYEFSGSNVDMKGRRRLICKSCEPCNFSIYVDNDEFNKAEDGSIATIVDTRNHHHKCTQI